MKWWRGRGGQVILATEDAVRISEDTSPRPKSMVLKMCSLDQQHTNITWELSSNADSWVPLQTDWTRDSE